MSSPTPKEAHIVERKKKLIEVALPLVAINKACAREKSIRHGHPSTLHVWWARRPLAAARAVIFAQMVDDPSANPDLFPNEKTQEKERKRLFGILEELVKWENTSNKALLERAKAEIWQSWRRACAANVEHPHARDLFDREVLPAFHDPFAGGGALPLEAKRLGLEAHATDLNPVAVLINKALAEIPSKFPGRSPVNPETRNEKSLLAREWRGPEGLAADLRFYGKWIKGEAERRIGGIYPKVQVTPEMVAKRQDLVPYKDRELTVLAWIWARTVKSPNPAFAEVEVPLASTFMLSTKKGKEAYVEPVIEGGGYRFEVNVGRPRDPEATKAGTKLSRGANFRCLMSGTPMDPDHIYTEAKAGRMGARLMAIVAEGDRGRLYLPPTPEHERAALQAEAQWKPDVAMPENPRWFSPPLYGLTTFGDLFTPRQLLTLTTFSDLVGEVRERILHDALAAVFAAEDTPLAEGGSGARAYAEAVSAYLGLVVSKETVFLNTVARWRAGEGKSAPAFGRQAIAMVWDYADINPLAGAGGDFTGVVEGAARVLEGIPGLPRAFSDQEDAMTQTSSAGRVVSTDPPYYDNIGYADLSDFFYVWLRRSLRPLFPGLFATVAVPKAEELVATPYRHGGKDQAEAFFMDGMARAMRRLAEQAHPAFPITIYYAFKQSEREGETGTASTGWETFLDAVIRAGLSVTGTWPMRTEGSTRLIGMTTNALASSIVLVCCPRRQDAPTTSRREFLQALKAELPDALAHLQKSNIAPVDLAQAAIGPGMAVYTRYSRVLESNGSPLSVRTALALINQVLDEVLAEQEGDFDPDSRWALAWFEQSGFDEGDYGVAETLSKAKNTSVQGLVDAGVLASRGGKVHLLSPADLPEDWDPTTDSRLTVWEMVHHLVRVLEAGGEGAAAELAAKLDSQAETARELAYRLYSVCERKKRASEALAYNGLVQSWPEIMRLAREGARPRSEQADLFGETED